MPSEDVLKIRYDFRFDDGSKAAFRLRLDPQKLTPLDPPKKNLPDWTRLGFKQCQHCPLPDTTEHCPLAARLHPVVDSLRDVVSTQQVEFYVRGSQRTTVGKVSAQEGLSSILGVTMATSGCPWTAFFRPMARFHLPFADMEETVYRSVSSYLMAQYLRSNQGQEPDYTLQGLTKLYERVAEVNRRMVDRLRSTSRQDGTINALVILDVFAQGLPLHLEDMLEDMAGMFEGFFDMSPEQLTQEG